MIARQRLTAIRVLPSESSVSIRSTGDWMNMRKPVSLRRTDMPPRLHRDRRAVWHFNKEDSPPLSCTLSSATPERENAGLIVYSPQGIRRTEQSVTCSFSSSPSLVGDFPSLPFPLPPSRRDEEEIIQTRQRNSAFGCQDLRTGPETSPPEDKNWAPQRRVIQNEDKEGISMPPF